MKKINIFIAILVLVAVALEVVNVYLANKLSTESIYAAKLVEDVRTVKQKNFLLKSEVLRFTSFENVSSRAGELGFVEAKEFISLYAPLNVALKE